MSESSLSQVIIERLRTKASASRSRVARNTEQDKNCDMTEEYHYKKGIVVTNFTKVLSGFLSRSTIDLPSLQPYGTPAKALYREAEKHHYIFLDTHADPAALEMDKRWLKTQDDYIMRLRKEQLFDLFGYTYNGDVFVNNYVRGTFDPILFQGYLENFDIAKGHYFALFFPALRVLKRFSNSEEMLRLVFRHPPSDIEYAELGATIHAESLKMRYMKLVAIAPKLSYERFWIPVLEDYRDAIEHIISRAPPTPKPVVLYRGVESDYFLTKFMKNHMDRVHVANSFVSTSSSISVASDFANYENKCCFMRLYIPKGSRLLMMMGISRFNESEFLLSNKTQFYITKARTEKFCRQTHNIEMRTSSLVVI